MSWQQPRPEMPCSETSGAFYVNGKATVCQYQHDVAACDGLVDLIESWYA